MKQNFDLQLKRSHHPFPLSPSQCFLIMFLFFAVLWQENLAEGEGPQFFLGPSVLIRPRQQQKLQNAISPAGGL